MSDPIGFAIVWSAGPQKGRMQIFHGRLAAMSNGSDNGEIKGDCFCLAEQSSPRLNVVIAEAKTDPGAFATRVTLWSETTSFTFFLRDVNQRLPLYMPAFGAAVIADNDSRSYAEIDQEMRSRGLLSMQQQIDSEPEESYEAACAATRDMFSPVWLGLSRDIRMFSVGYDDERPYGYWGYVKPRYHSVDQSLEEADGRHIRLDFAVSRGAGCAIDISRRLDEGVLPILHSLQKDDEVQYHLTAFATMERQPLAAELVHGTDFRQAYAFMGGNMLDPDESERIRRQYLASLAEQEPVLCVLHWEAVNTGTSPHYAYFKAMTCSGAVREQAYDEQLGSARFKDGRIFTVHRLNGCPLPQEQVAVLLMPGDSVSCDYIVPHEPVSEERARRLLQLDYAAHLTAVRSFWKSKLLQLAQAEIPEPAIHERIRAGVLHCDLAAIGTEPGGSIAATIGRYAPIGSESSPIIQFLDSVGWHTLAERALEFFLDRQQADGFMQNFGGYQLETGPALWSMGEHWRYTRDDGWVQRIKPKLLKAVAYLLQWRQRNMQPQLRGCGYGLLAGKVADPQDFYHSFMLNGMSYIGIARVAEMLQNVDAAEARRLAKEADAFRTDIRTAYYETMARSPLVPVGDGSWIPSYAPWTEYPGPLSLYAEGGQWFTHGAFQSRDSLIGALYLIIGEVLEPNETATTFLLQAHQELHTARNAAFSQPYYARHDFGHIKRGEVKAFLKTYYNQFTALQDRQSYSFWEHYYHASEHKTHEEGWFLMQTRWMLYLEEGAELCLLPAIPRKWLENGKTIDLDNWVSYFGPFSLHVQSKLEKGIITATVICNSNRRPESVTVRLPHPAARRPVRIEGGDYDEVKENVRIPHFSGTAEILLQF